MITYETTAFTTNYSDRWPTKQARLPPIMTNGSASLFDLSDRRTADNEGARQGGLIHLFHPRLWDRGFRVELRPSLAGHRLPGWVLTRAEHQPNDLFSGWLFRDYFPWSGQLDVIAPITAKNWTSIQEKLFATSKGSGSLKDKTYSVAL